MRIRSLLALAIALIISSCVTEEPVSMYIISPNPEEIKNGAPMLGKGTILDREMVSRTFKDSTIIEIVNDKTGQKSISFARKDPDAVMMQSLAAYRAGAVGMMLPTRFWNQSGPTLTYKGKKVKRIAAITHFEPFPVESETRERGLALTKRDSLLISNISDSLIIYVHGPLENDSLFLKISQGKRLTTLGVYRSVIDVVSTGFWLSAVTEEETEGGGGMIKIRHQPMPLFASITEGVFALDSQSLQQFWWEKGVVMYGAAEHKARVIELLVLADRRQSKM